MSNEYKVQELADFIQLSRQAIYDKIETGEFKTIERRVKGKKIKFVVLTDKEYNSLIDQYGVRQSSQVENTVNNSQPDKSLMNTADTLDKILRFTENYIQDLKNLNQENKELYSQVKLIEDKQRTAQQDSEFYKNSYFEMKHQNEMLTNENKSLREKLNQLEDNFNKLNKELEVKKEKTKRWWQVKI